MVAGRARPGLDRRRHRRGLVRRGALRHAPIWLVEHPVRTGRYPDESFSGTPEYARYEGSDPYEITRGVDHSFGYNRNSGPDAFLDRAALTSLVRDTAADGGNVLLNVGPRGEDATIPAEQSLRLEWLAEDVARQ
ncbi:hypothetical protein SCALM49S_00645 [Streptomyces californicus]